MHPPTPTAPRRRLLAVVVASTLAAAPAAAQKAASRGELLYATHCIECHTTQMHWRDQRRAQDWDTLKAQVRRWQHEMALRWSDADIAEVARHLNDTIYHYPQTADRLGRASPQGPR